MHVLGIDIGGSGIKAAPVDVESGQLVAERYRVSTPSPSAPEPVADAIAEIARHFQWRGAIGCTFPAPIKGGVAQTAANVDQAWIGCNGEELFQAKTGLPVRLINDADAAGIAEITFGAGKDQRGVIFVLTFGTGIGSAIFVNGCLMPNTELGHMELGGRESERWASDAARRRKKLTWEQWAERVQVYLERLEVLFSPDLFIVGGGASRNHERFLPLLRTHAPVVPAAMLNDAGIVGAALAAKDLAAEDNQQAAAEAGSESRTTGLQSPVELTQTAGG